MSKKRVVVIGAGFGGISSACYLAKLGLDVTIIEKNLQPGGRAAQLVDSGFTFDLGPSWYWTPNIFERFFNDFGKTHKDFFELIRLNPSYKIFWNSSEIDEFSTDINQIYEIFERYEKNSSKKLEKILKDGEFILNLALEKFLYREYNSIIDLLKKDLVLNGIKLNIFTNLENLINKNFKNSRLKKIVTWQSLFLGATPKILPAMYMFMIYVDFVLGTWYPKGGIFEISKALQKLAEKLGVKFIFGEEVQKILVNSKNFAYKVLTKNSNEFEFDYLVANADYPYVETQLLDPQFQSYDINYWNKKKVSPSSLLYYFGINKKISNIIHHNFYFNEESWDSHFGSLFTKPDWPENPSIYFSATSKTDNTAPQNMENIFVLVPVASGLEDTEDIKQKYKEYVINKIEELTHESLKQNIIVEHIISHSDQIKMYNAFKGSCFGLAQTLFQSLSFRPKNRSKKVKNLFYAGHFTHPGISMPMTLISGKVVANMIAKIENLN